MSDVTIICCRPRGYEKRARDVAAALRRQLALESDLVPGKGRILQIRLGDRIGGDDIVAAVAAARH